MNQIFSNLTNKIIIFFSEKIKERRINHYFRKAANTYNKEEKIAYYTKCLTINPEHALAYTYRGIEKQGLKQYENAISDLEKAIEINAKMEIAHYYLGVIKYELAQYEAAIAHSNTAISIKNNYLFAYYCRASAFYMQKKHTEAIADWDKIIALNPAYINAYIYRTSNNLALLKYDLVEIDAKKIISLNPKLAYGYNCLGIALHQKREYEAALQQFEIARSLNDFSSLHYFNCGLVKNDLHLYEEAILDFDKAIEKKIEGQHLYLAYAERGLAKQRLERYEEAESDYDEALSLKPDLVCAYLNKGLIKLHTNQVESALADFDKALEIDDKYSVAIYNKACVYSKLMQDKENALLLLKQSIELGEENRELAKTDTDFEWLWEDANFLQIIHNQKDIDI